MSKVLYCNSFETTRTKEIFLLLFRFNAPDGYEETVYIALSPSGAAALHELLEKEIQNHVQKFGDIVMGNWETKEPNHDCDKSYLS